MLKACLRAAVAFAIFFMAPAWGQAPCPGCNPASAHPVDYCQTGGSNGDPYVYFNRGAGESGAFNVASVLTKGCELYAKAHSSASVIASFEACVPRLPDPAIGSFGGSWGATP